MRKPRTAKMKIKDIQAFLDTHGITGTWSGGNDSGGIDETSAEHDLDAADTAKLHLITNWIYDKTLGPEFGSWAGDFDARGTISYNKETKCIIVEGASYDQENAPVVATKEVKLSDHITEEDMTRIEAVRVNVNDHSGAEVEIIVPNGPWTDSLVNAEEKIKAAFEEQLDEYPEDGEYKYWISELYPPSETVSIPISKAEEQVLNWELILADYETEEEVEVDEY